MRRLRISSSVARCVSVGANLSPASMIESSAYRPAPFPIASNGVEIHLATSCGDSTCVARILGNSNTLPLRSYMLALACALRYRSVRLQTSERRCLIKPLKGRSVQACPFRKFDPVGIRAVRQNHRTIRVDAFEHPRCRPRARAHPPSIRIRHHPPANIDSCSTG